MVRRQRETGMKGLGQVLKSFRDRSTDFSVYDRASGTDAYLKTLGPLELPGKGATAGLDTMAPEMRVPYPQLSTGSGIGSNFAQKSPPAFAAEPLANPTAGTATPFADATTTEQAIDLAALPNPPVKPGVLTGTDGSSID
jgi:hypothetical protein